MVTTDHSNCSILVRVGPVSAASAVVPALTIVESATSAASAKAAPARAFCAGYPTRGLRHRRCGHYLVTRDNAVDSPPPSCWLNSSQLVVL